MGLSQEQLMETIKEKIEKCGMVISRIPEWAKEAIKSVALAEHSDDYGACIAQFIREANEYRILKTKFFDNDMNVTISYPEQIKDEESVITLANGKKLNINGGKNEQNK